MVLPESLMTEYEKRGELISSTVSRIDQKILNEFIRCGAFERHLNRMRKIYKGKHDVLLDSLKGFRKKFKIEGDHAGSHILLCAKYEVTEQWLKEKAEEKGIKVYCLSDYVIKNESYKNRPATVILGYAGMDTEDIEKGITELKKAWEI